jgi:hypothetical protein
MLATALEPRQFLLGWWHAGDIASATEVLVESLAKLGVPGFPAERFAVWTEEAAPQFDDEEDMRRHQAGFAAAYANEALARAGDPRRVRALGRVLEWESEEPAWLVLTPEEHAALVTIAGPPRALERIYDGVEMLDAVRPPQPAPIAPEELSPREARGHAEAAFREGHHEEALRFLRVFERGEVDLLGELLRLDILRCAGREDEARAVWGATADRWLGGSIRVWDTQWRRLVELHAKLGLRESERLARANAAMATAPR